MSLRAAAAVLLSFAAGHSASSMAQMTDPYAPWARVLAKNVDHRGRVDFHAVATDQADLDSFLSMFNVIDSGFPRALGPVRRLAFFGVNRFRIGGERMSLYTLENDVIRPLGDERVHFALNCMSVGCPRLPREPFRPERLSGTLDAMPREFFAEPRNLEILPEQKRARVSSILKFYREDFLKKAPTLIAYVNRYRSPPIPEDYAVEFIDYDWTVNDQRQESGEHAGR